MAANPVLASGEPGFETDTGKFKVGIGATWGATAYMNAAAPSPAPNPSPAPAPAPGPSPAPAPSTQVPSNSAAPTITGTTQVGQALTGNHGAWSNSPTSYVYQWTRGATVVSTTQTYVPVQADVGQVLTFSELASTAAGPASTYATSAPTAAVTAAQAPAPSPTPAPPAPTPSPSPSPAPSPPPAPSPSPAPSPAPAPPPAGADATPSFAYGLANAAGTASVFDAMFANKTNLTNATSSGRTGTFNTIADPTKFTWVRVQASIAGATMRFFDSSGPGGFSGAKSSSVGAFNGDDQDPITNAFLTYTDANGVVWQCYRTNGRTITYTGFSIV